MIKLLTIISTLLITLAINASYSQELVGLTTDRLIFSEDLYLGEKTHLAKNANSLTLDSMISRQYKKATRMIPPLLLREVDTLYCKVYVFDNRKLIVKYCGMALFENNKLFWSHDYKDCISNSHDYAHRGNAVLYFAPLFSDDFKSLLYKDDNSPMFINRSAIVEVDLNTGKRYIIKNKCKNPRYSPDGKYILLQDLKKDSVYYVYDRAIKRIIRTYRNLRALYWI